MGPFKRFIASRLFGKGRNLITLDDPYTAMGRLLARDSVVGLIDVGASHGRVSKRLLRQFPGAKAYLFEPNPAYQTILNNEQSNDARLHPQFLAVADHDGTATLNITASAGTTSLLQPSATLTATYADEAAVVERRDVPLTTLDTWASRVPDVPIQLIKLDIQGGELAALRGARRLLTTSIRLVYTEIMFNQLYEGGAVFADLDAELRACGFRLHDIYKPRYNPAGMLMWGNAIYLRDA
jgi:FkbM family methyltransferase